MLGKVRGGEGDLLHVSARLEHKGGLRSLTFSAYKRVRKEEFRVENVRTQASNTRERQE